MTEVAFLLRTSSFLILRVAKRFKVRDGRLAIDEENVSNVFSEDFDSENSENLHSIEEAFRDE